MSLQVTVNVFLIKRLNVVLMVVFRSTGLVKVEPYQCKEENLRLWAGIAKTQMTLVQIHLQQSKERNQLQLVQSLFQHGGWEVELLEEKKEFSL